MRISFQLKKHYLTPGDRDQFLEGLFGRGSNSVKHTFE